MVKTILTSEQVSDIECKVGAVNGFLSLFYAQIAHEGADVIDGDVLYLICDAQKNLKTCREILEKAEVTA